MATLIKGARIVNEGRCFDGSIVIDDEKIVDIIEGDAPLTSHLSPLTTIDASCCYVLPGVIDTHVHFREPGMTEKADIESESRAAAAGGVTSYFEMPNTVPQTTTLEALDEKFRRAAESSHVNYTFFFGATNDNVGLFSQLDPHRVPGIKLFMGSSTGNMLVDRDEALDRIFASAKLPIMAHCEDTAIINRNMALAKQGHGDDPDVSLHPLIRSEEACLKSTEKAVALAKKHHARLHVAHLSTAEELELFPSCSAGSDSIAATITAEATVGHLYFSMLDYQRLGARIKVNPAIKSPVDQFMLRESLNDGRLTTIATDHAPHLLSQKQGGCARAASGMPMVQFSLPTMLELVDQKVLTIERLVELMVHNPARLFEVRQRGFIRLGYQADVVIVRPRSPWTVTPDVIESKCKWSPMEGHTFNWRVEQTFCNGHLVYNNGVVDRTYIGQPLAFR
ncbi:MAG: dihydroorotase [Prevotella sp.]|nr:dihydroorotase [Prevotella sp.]